jgi:hypothetical protein
MKVLWTLNIQVLVLGTFSFFLFFSFLFFSFEQAAIESKQKIYVPSFDAKEKNKF